MKNYYNYPISKKIVAILTACLLILTNPIYYAYAGTGEWVTNGPEDCNVYQIVVSPKYATNKTLYCATDNGIYKSINGGQSWTLCGLTDTQVSDLAISPVQSTYDTLYAGTGSSVYKSTNSGSSWSISTAVSGSIQSIAVSPAYSTDKTVFVGTDGYGVFRTTDAGDSWTQSSGDSSFNGMCVSSVAFSPAFSTDNTAFATSSDGCGVYKTTDSGDNWSQCATASTVGLFLTTVAVSPTYASDHTVFAGKYFSSDSGSTWSDITGLASVDVSCLSFSPTFASDHTVIAGTYEDGVFVSSNGGLSWTQYDTQSDLDILYVKSVGLTPNFSTNHLAFAGTWGNGVYSCITSNDRTPPVIVRSDPTSTATGVPKNKTISIKFSENIVQGSAYSLIVLKDSLNKQVTIGKTINANNPRELLLDPTSDLSLSTVYRATIPAGAVKDSNGNSFAASSTITFTVAGVPDVTAPKVSTTDPTSGASTVATDKTVSVTFSEAIQSSSAYSSITLVDKTKTSVAFKATISSDGKTLTIDPTSDLPTGTTYTLTLPKSCIKDTSGNDLATASTLSFTVPVDKTAPAVSSTTPSASSTAMAKDSTMTVAFSENIQAGTAYDTITLKDASSNSITMTKTISGKELTIDPSSNLTPGTTYTLTLPAAAVKDSSSNMLAAQYTLTFTVKNDSETPLTPKGFSVTSTSNNVIQLSWSTNTETDLAGYFVYRSIKGETAAASKLNSSAITATSYSDSATTIGKTYVYTVSAVDNDNHESSKSSEVQAALGVPPTPPTTSTPEPQPSTPFKDVPADAWYLEFVTTLASSGVVSGYTDGNFRPANKVTRAEFAKMLCTVMGWETSGTTKASFSDVSSDFWGFDFIETAKSKGALGGYEDGTFRPNKYITRAEITKMIAGTLKLKGGSSTLKDIDASWASSYIKACVQAGIVSGYSDGTFKPGNNATRAEVSKMVAAVSEQNTTGQ
jgi:methionine-rich copper-binding protein CopC